jgi:site-specific DNA-methyltransferase (adenine-specific)
MIELDKIYNEDCLDGMSRIDDFSIDAVICDPPYGTTDCNFDISLPMDKLWSEYRRIVKPNGNILMFASGRFMFDLYASQPQLYRYDLIWKKSKCGSPFTAKYMPMKKHEHILVFGQSGAAYYPQMEQGEPYHRHWTPNKSNNHHYGINGTEHHNDGTRHPSTILDFPQKWRRQDQLHPTQKPVELMQWLVRSYSKEGDVILDNCAGSGSTLLACIREHRHWIGFETDKNYFDIATERINNEK